MAQGVVLRMQSTRRYIIFDVHQIHFNLIPVEGVERHAILNMHNLWASLGFYYHDPLYFRNALCYIINLFGSEKTFARTEPLWYKKCLPR